MFATTTFDPVRRPVAFWLLACCALVFAIVVVGGVTRLTHSGLSIVEWQPIVGAIPPLDAAQWQETFERYKQTPEFRLRNHDMTLAGFKAIFWWEYAHRLLGRVIGLVVLLPLVYFWRKGHIDAVLGRKLLVVFALGAVQGAVGWYMVKSGLVDDPRVSSLRLALHLGIAFVIYGCLLWIALSLLTDPIRDARGPRGHAGLVLVWAFVTVIAGALVAGIRAGLAYNTFPLMNGHWIPPEVMSLDPAWRNFVYNMATVQLVHRVLAIGLALAVLVLWWRIDSDGRVHDRGRKWNQALVIAAIAQVGLGIATLLLRVPVWLAALHQAGALLVFTSAVGLRHSLRSSGISHMRR